MTSTSKQRKEQRWLAIQLTHLPLESLGVARSHRNIIVSYKDRVCSATDNLSRLGVERGMPTSTAQLLHNTEDETPCRVYQREHDSEDYILDKLSKVLYTYTPYIEPYRVTREDHKEDIGLIVELSGSVKLFHGLQALITNMTVCLQQQGFSYKYGLGHTKHIAWLLSYGDQNIDTSHTNDDFIRLLSPLDTSRLYQYPEAAEKLRNSGFFTFAALIQHIEHSSLQSLRKRLGCEATEYIRQLLGIETDFSQVNLFQTAPPSYEPPLLFSESIHFDYPVSNCEQLVDPIINLLSSLSNMLTTTQKQTGLIHWHFYDIYHQEAYFSLQFQRLYRDYQFIADLTMIRLENQPLPFEIDVLELRCDQIIDLKMPHTSITNKGDLATQEKELTNITTKLTTRLGDKAVFTLSPKDSHIPELSFSKTNIDSSTQRFSPETDTKKSTIRPSWIFNTPIKAGKRQNELFWQGRLELLQGPERIEGLWWKKPTGRDYFVAKRDDNVRLWVFHDLYKNAWFVHGVFA